jgi:hypothetical protein
MSSTRCCFRFCASTKVWVPTSVRTQWPRSVRTRSEMLHAYCGAERFAPDIPSKLIRARDDSTAKAISEATHAAPGPQSGYDKPTCTTARSRSNARDHQRLVASTRADQERREWDSNPRCLHTTVFKTVPIGRSGIPPSSTLPASQHRLTADFVTPIRWFRNGVLLSRTRRRGGARRARRSCRRPPGSARTGTRACG